MDWYQYEDTTVEEYVRFIRMHYVNYWKRDNRWWRKFGNFNPNSMEEWFLDGLLENVSDEMHRILQCREMHYEDLSLKELADVAQDAEDILMLEEKQTERHVRGTCFGHRNRGYLVNDYGYVIAYTDGACPGNGTPYARAGVGVWFSRNHRENISESIPECMCDTPTNNIAELWAMIRALEIAGNNSISHLEVRSDSDYLINSLNQWIFNWLENGWINSKGQPIMHKHLFRLLLSKIRDVKVKWVHIPRECNTEADYLARVGAE